MDSIVKAPKKVKYDPESYRKLVREREGYTALERKDESEDDDEE